MTSPEYRRRERQFEIDRICAAYADEVESGRNPDPKDYLTRYPEYATELADYIITYHLSLADLPELDETPEPVRSPAFARALAAIYSLSGLEDRSFDVGLDPEQLAERVGVSPSFIARLDAKAIAATSIPRELFRRLAVALDVRMEAVMAFLGASLQTGGAFFHADQAPTGGQDDFLAAIEASDDLDPARKAEWRAISARERGE
ncbi:MAG TPA: helix-turn-helix transcriptional regulator [Ktedonobacterales bacterium]|nr:helix-turn-helix transcriptional regulator [Ktedonobacterales bacterium]